MISKFHRLSTPGALPSMKVFIASMLAMVVVVIFDVITPADIRLHVLYIFPLAAVAVHCKRIPAVQFEALLR